VVDRIHSDEGAFFEMGLSGPDRTDYGFANGGREDVLGADLNDTWTLRSAGRKKHPEIQIVREDDPAAGDGKLHNLGVWRPRLTDR
jgi:hypothetical protein